MVTKLFFPQNFLEILSDYEASEHNRIKSRYESIYNQNYDNDLKGIEARYIRDVSDSRIHCELLSCCLSPFLRKEIKNFELLFIEPLLFLRNMGEIERDIPVWDFILGEIVENESFDQRYSKKFAFYIKALTEKVLVDNGFSSVAGLPFSGKITNEMLTRAIKYGYMKRQIVLTRDKSSVRQIRGGLKLELCRIISKIIVKNHNQLTSSEVLALFESEILKLNNIELLLALENPVSKITLQAYFSNLIEYIIELARNSARTNKIAIYKVNRIFRISDREGYEIYRYLRRIFPQDF